MSRGLKSLEKLPHIFNTELVIVRVEHRAIAISKSRDKVVRKLTIIHT